MLQELQELQELQLEHSWQSLQIFIKMASSARLGCQLIFMMLNVQLISHLHSLGKPQLKIP